MRVGLRPQSGLVAALAATYIKNHKEFRKDRMEVLKVSP